MLASHSSFPRRRSAYMTMVMESEIRVQAIDSELAVVFEFKHASHFALR